jgi:hypothetical protein
MTSPRSVSEHTYEEVTGLLCRMLDKIVKNPQEGKFRRILLAFPLIQKTLGASTIPVQNRCWWVYVCELFSFFSSCFNGCFVSYD